MTTVSLTWYSGKVTKRSCNILWGSFASKRRGLAEQLPQAIKFSFSNYFVFQTGDENWCWGSWKLTIWMNDCPKKCIRELWREDFYAGTSISPILWQSLAYVCFPWWHKSCFKGKLFQKLSHQIYLSEKLAEYEFWLKNIEVLVTSVELDERTVPAEVISQTWCDGMTQFLLQAIYKSIQICHPLWKCVYPIENRDNSTHHL